MRVEIDEFPLAILMPGHIKLHSTLNVLVGDRIICVPAGTRSNFGSIPWFVRWLISPIDPALMIPAVVHDYETGEFNRATADWRTAAKNLNALMKHGEHYAEGKPWVRRLKRHAVYRAVMLFGILKGRAKL